MATTNLEFLFLKLKELDIELRETKEEVKGIKTIMNELKLVLNNMSLQITCNNLGLPSKIESNELISIDRRIEIKKMKKFFKNKGSLIQTRMRNTKKEQNLFDDAMIALFQHYYYYHLIGNSENYLLNMDDFTISNNIFLDHVANLDKFLQSYYIEYISNNPLKKIKQRLRHMRTSSWSMYKKIETKERNNNSKNVIKENCKIKIHKNNRDDIRYKYLKSLLEHKHNNDISYFLNEFQFDHGEFEKEKEIFFEDLKDNNRKRKNNTKNIQNQNEKTNTLKRSRTLHKESNNKQLKLNFISKKQRENRQFHGFGSSFN